MNKRILSTLLALCMMLALLPGTALAENVAFGQYGSNIAWELSDQGTLTIKGTGTIPYGTYVDDAPWSARRGQIKKLVIQNGVTGINRLNFYECGNLVSVTIPTSVTWINEDAFERCSNLEHIYYEGTEEQWGKISIHSYNNKPFFSSKCRIHYKGSPNTSTVSSGKYGENLVWSDNGSGTLTISGTGKLPYCTYVEDMPWAYRRSTLKKIVIKEGVTSIGRLSFYDCVSVVSVVIPASVTYIGEDAFEHCSKLEHVYYAGTQSQWSEIKIDSSNNGYLYSSKCQIHANSTGPIETCTVTLNPNGGTVSKRSITVTPGRTYSGLPTPTRSGYTFSGWYTASSGGARVTASTTVTNSSNHTLYAHWTTSPVSVRSMESGSWRVTVPAGSRLALYGSETSAAQATSATISRDTALTCTRMAVLSNGTVRYYAKINSGSSYWFCYSDEMAVN